MPTERPIIEVPTPAEGWDHPWGNVAELAEVLTPEDWTLVGGLMVKTHAALAGIPSVRTTIDIDMVVHLETARDRAQRVHRTMTEFGYVLKSPHDLGSLSGTDHAHRYLRGDPKRGGDIVDVMRADHAAPRVIERLSGHSMLPIEGTTQALRRTFNARMELRKGETFLVSVPDAYGALILKAAAHMVDSRDRDRHLRDAVTLLVCIDDPFAVAEKPAYQSDRRRLIHLQEQLLDVNSTAWSVLEGDARDDARANLLILIDATAG